MNLTPLTITDYPTLKQFFQGQPYTLSPYSLASIVVWSGQGFQSFYAIVDAAVIIANEAACRVQDRHLMLPVSPQGSRDPEHLFDLAEETGIASYWYVPEDYVERYGRSRIERFFHVTDQPEYDDYVYLTEDLALLKGNRYAKKRNLIHQFTREYGGADRIAIEEMSGANAAESVDFLLKWCDVHACDAAQQESIACEKRAVTTAIENLSAVEAEGFLIRLDGVVSAFAIGSHLNADMCTLNFEKAFPHIRGLYQYLDRECARRALGRYRYVNKESDLNIPNLAQSKKSYFPAMKIKSYRLHLT